MNAAAAAAGFGTRFLLYTEPDKAAFFARHLQSFIGRAPDDTGTGIVVAARSDGAFETFPPTQRYTEGMFNHLCGEAAGLPGDYAYGRFLMSRASPPSCRTFRNTSAGMASAHVPRGAPQGDATGARAGSLLLSAGSACGRRGANACTGCVNCATTCSA